MAISDEHIGVTDLTCADVKGPLFAIESGAPALVGMASFHALDQGAPSTTYPTIFTRVSAHQTWIQDTIASVPPAAMSVWTDLGHALPGVNGSPLLAGTGPLTAGSAGSIQLTHAASAPLSLLFASTGSTLTPFKCGTLVPSFSGLPNSPLIIATSTGSAAILWSSWPAGASGLCIYFQCVVPDTAAVCGFAISNALRAAVP